MRHPQSSWVSGFVRRACMAPAATVTVLAAGPCLADAPAAEIQQILQPVVTRQQYQQVVARLNLDEHGRFVLDVAYGNYAAAIEHLQQEATKRAELAGLRELRAATDGRQPASQSQIAAWELAVLEEAARDWPAIDLLLNRFMDDVQLTATGAASGRAATELRRLRRELMLHPRRPHSIEARAEVGDGVDLIRLLEQPGIPGLDWHAVAPADLREQAAPDLARIVIDYELAMDSLIQSSFAAYRAGRLAIQRAVVSKNADALRQEEQAAYHRWLAVHQLNRRTAERLAATLTASGMMSAAATWMDRVDQATCPWLFANEFPDRAAEWIAAQESIDADVRQRAAAAHAQFAARRRDGRQRVVEQILKGRADTQSMAHPTGMRPQIDLDAHRARAVQAMDAAVHSLIALEAEARSTLLNLLTDAQRVQMQRDLQAADRRKRER